MGKVLIIDDDQMMGKAVSTLAKRMGHKAVVAFTLEDGLKKASEDAFDVVFLDVMMPDGSGLGILPQIAATESEPEVIVITASGDPEGAELAIKEGAWDYVEKSASIQDLLVPLARALQYREEKTSDRTDFILNRGRIIGSSARMKACLELLAQASCSDASVLITGETGTGKELFARAIHSNRPRTEKNLLENSIQSKKPDDKKQFVVVDCTALPEKLVESVLFGHEKGAFTGADKTQEGLVAQANGGTLFLDEVGELPLVAQKTFLRVLQERQFRPVGAKKEKESEFRLISATNKDLDAMAEAGEFRKDLLYRLRSLNIDLPPLKTRGEDIRDLTRFHVARLCDRYEMAKKGFSPDLFEALESYEWPGNVRELVNTLDAAVTLSGNDPTLFSKHLPMHIRIQMVRASFSKDFMEPDFGRTNDFDDQILSFKEYRSTMEKKYLQRLLYHAGQDTKKACEVSGLSRSRFYELLAKHQISVPKS